MNEKPNPKLRVVIILLLIVGITFALAKLITSKGNTKAGGGNTLALKGVSAMLVAPSENTASVVFSGKLTAIDRIEVFSELPGVLLSDNFKEGNTFAKGEAIIRIESAEAKNTIKAQKSQLLNQVSLLMGDIGIDYPAEKASWVGFLNQIDVQKALPALPETNNEKFRRFLSGKNVLNTYYNIQSAEERLSKYDISAPFTGVVTQSLLKRGTLVRAGQKLGEFVKPGSYEIETEVSMADLEFIKKGDKVNLSSDELPGTWIGEIYRINDKVDEASQLVKVYAKVQSNDLKEGLYLNGSAKGSKFPNSTVVHRSLLSDNRIMVLEDSVVAERTVNVLYKGADHAIIEGLKAGEKVITSPTKSLYPGQKVREIAENK